MEQRKEIVNRYVHQGLTVAKAVTIAGISKSTFYYQSNGRKPGKRPSRFTLHDEEQVPNDRVVEVIEETLAPEFIDYGYRRITGLLRKNKFKINRKKVYRLMNENGLLQRRKKSQNRVARNFVRYTCPEYKHPFATIEIDIKYIYLSEQRRNAYLLTALDTFTRMALAWELALTMKTERVIKLLVAIKNHPKVEPYRNRMLIRIRTDNGPQFIANDLRIAISRAEFDHEFIQPGTPQQNGHIEAFHSTLQNIVVNHYDLTTISEATDVLERFFHVYNNVRVMDAILGCTPAEFLDQWENGTIEIRERNRKQKFFFRERQVISDAALSREDSFGCIKNML
jgi:putative transposase